MKAQRGHLQAVPDAADAKPGTKPPRRKATTITEALGGSSLDVLTAMRRALAKKLDDGEVSSNSIASAYKELRELDRLIRQHQSSAEEVDSAARRDQDDDAFDPQAI